MAARLFCLAACVLALGCGKKGPSVATFPVTGKVTLKGKPLVGAHINFANKNPDRFSASGTTDEQGKFRLSTYVTPTDLRVGAESGEYTVLVTKPVAVAQAAGLADAEKMKTASNEERQKLMMKQWEVAMKQQRDAETNPSAVPKSEVPEKYGNTETSPLKNVMVANGENPPFEWDLTD